MKNVVAKTFLSPLTIDEILGALQRSETGINWQGHSSDLPRGDHVGALTPDTSIDIYCEDWAFLVEVYFPAEKQITDADKHAFLQRFESEILPAVQGKKITEEALTKRSSRGHVVSTHFESPLVISKMLEPLREVVGIQWSEGVVENRMFSVYFAAPPDIRLPPWQVVQGAAANDIKIRIIQVPKWTILVYFRKGDNGEDLLSDSDKEAFLHRLTTEVLPAVQAEKVTSEWE